MASTLRKFGSAAGECPEINPTELKELRSESAPDQIASWAKLTFFFSCARKGFPLIRSLAQTTHVRGGLTPAQERGGSEQEVLARGWARGVDVEAFALYVICEYQETAPDYVRYRYPRAKFGEKPPGGTQYVGSC